MTAAARFRDDVLGEPRSLGALLDAGAAPGGAVAAARSLVDGATAVRFAGLGSSRYAALATAAALRARGRDAAAEIASAAVASPPGAGTVLVAISASGATPETVATAERHAGRSAVLAVTNEPQSPLADAADVVVPMLAGREGGGVACRTYLATLAILELVAGTGAADLRPVVEALASLHAGHDAWLGTAADLLEDAGSVAVVAPEDRIGNAEQGALVLREAPRLAATAFETGDWGHVGVYLTVHADHRVVLLPGSAGDAEVARWTRSRGTPVLAIGGGPGDVTVPTEAAPPLVRRLAETSALELIAAELWARRGGEPPTDV